jgi:membrane-bound lytic murein transglycosylase A
MTRELSPSIALPFAVLAAMIAHLLGGCEVDETKVTLRPTTFARVEGWAGDDHAAAFGALLKSCRKMESPDAACAAALALGDGIGREAACAFFEANYTPHAVEGGDTPGFVTAYYEPEVKGSRERGGAFQVPVYGRPPDLITLIPETDRARFNDRITGFRVTPDGQVPYYTRAEINEGALDGRGLELLYLDDPVELFYMQVQGSGVARLPDGSSLRLTYAGKNGYPYTSIGKLLVERGEIARGAANMTAVKAWLHADGARGRALMEENRSYVFFAELGKEASGPIGAEGVSLTPGRSLAVDAAYHRLGLPIFVTASDLADEAGKPFRRLMIAQDVGSAIRGPERGDIFFGTGEGAGAIAGGAAHPARFFILLPNR